MVTDPDNLIEAVGLTLYECECERAGHAYKVMSTAAQRSVPGILMEPWEECKDAFLSDAKAAILATLEGIREPTIEMEDAGDGLDPDGTGAKYVWQAMLTTLLASMKDPNNG